MRKSIKVTPEARRTLEKSFGCSSQFVYNSLNYVKNGSASRRIRQAALELGGIYTPSEFTPNCKILFQGDKIIQDFGASVVLSIDRETGKAVITVGDEVVRMEEEPVRMSTWNVLTQEAQKLAVQRIVNNA